MYQISKPCKTIRVATFILLTVHLYNKVLLIFLFWGCILNSLKKWFPAWKEKSYSIKTNKQTKKNRNNNNKNQTYSKRKRQITKLLGGKKKKDNTSESNLDTFLINKQGEFFVILSSCSYEWRHLALWWYGNSNEMTSTVELYSWHIKNDGSFCILNFLWQIFKKGLSLNS